MGVFPGPGHSSLHSPESSSGLQENAAVEFARQAARGKSDKGGGADGVEQDEEEDEEEKVRNEESRQTTASSLHKEEGDSRQVGALASSDQAEEDSTGREEKDRHRGRRGKAAKGLDGVRDEEGEEASEEKGQKELEGARGRGEGGACRGCAKEETDDTDGELEAMKKNEEVVQRGSSGGGGGGEEERHEKTVELMDIRRELDILRTEHGAHFKQRTQVSPGSSVFYSPACLRSNGRHCVPRLYAVLSTRVHVA